jgi:transcriptional regulator with XRE-family HTH domain
MQNFSERLQNLCIDSKKPQAEIARQFGISRQALYNIIKTGSEPSFDMLCKMADYFHVTTDFLLGKSYSELPLDGEERSHGLDALIENLKSCAFKGTFALNDALNKLLGKTLLKHKKSGIDIDTLVLKAVADVIKEWSNFIDSVGPVNKNNKSGKEAALNRLFYMADTVRNIIIKNGNDIILKHYPNNLKSQNEGETNGDST